MLPWPTRVHTLNGISIGSAVIAQITADSPHTLQRAAPFRLKIALSHGRPGPLSNTSFLVPTLVQNPNSISIGSAADRQKDHATWSVK